MFYPWKGPNTKTQDLGRTRAECQNIGTLLRQMETLHIFPTVVVRHFLTVQNYSESLDSYKLSTML